MTIFVCVNLCVGDFNIVTTTDEMKIIEDETSYEPLPFAKYEPLHTKGRFIKPLPIVGIDNIFIL